MTRRSVMQAIQYPSQGDKQLGGPILDCWSFQHISNDMRVCKCRLNKKCGAVFLYELISIARNHWFLKHSPTQNPASFMSQTLIPYGFVGEQRRIEVSYVLKIPRTYFCSFEKCNLVSGPATTQAFRIPQPAIPRIV